MFAEKDHDLPCAHELAEYVRANMLIPLECIDVYWTKLYMCPLASINLELVDDLGSHLTEELDTINQHFFVSNKSEKIMLLKRL